MRLLLCTGLFALVAPLLWPSIDPDEPAPTEPATADGCATGCAAIPDGIERLDVATIERLLGELAERPVDEGDAGGESDESGLALDTLLFHGERVAALWETLDRSALDESHRRFLRRELSRTHARLDVRFVDDRGVERLRLGNRRVPLGIKEHLLPVDPGDLPPPEISGTVRRVGLEHLWARL